MTDWGGLYRAHVDAISALAEGLDDAELAAAVPATPAWTVRDVLAHLAGGPADSITGRTDNAPGPEWTARHVGERVHLPVRDVLDELRANTDRVAVWADENARFPGIVYDIAVHHADLHEALGRHRLAEHFWRPVLDQLGERRAPALLTGGEVAPYELWRGLFSRRSRAQMRAWGTGLDEEALDAIAVFGPREDDQPVPS